jgi:hypothetical protein
MSDERNLRRKLGMSRRDLLRRGAIVGGTLLWTVPVIESLSHNSFAAGTFSTCCSCAGNRCSQANKKCFQGGTDKDTKKECSDFCKSKGCSKFVFQVGAPGTVCCQNNVCRKGTPKHPCP